MAHDIFEFIPFKLLPSPSLHKHSLLAKNSPLIGFAIHQKLDKNLVFRFNKHFVFIVLLYTCPCYTNIDCCLQGIRTYDYILAMREENQSMELESFEDSDFSSDDSIDFDYSPKKTTFVSRFICREQPINQVIFKQPYLVLVSLEIQNTRLIG